jgi:hypothetical protein
LKGGSYRAHPEQKFNVFLCHRFFSIYIRGLF